MSFFRDPNEPSSSEESEEGEEEEEELAATLDDTSQSSARESTGVAELIEPDTTTESLSLTNTISNGEDGVMPNRDEARDMMMASMLEELSRYKAAEMMNHANASNARTYDKSSPEVQDFAKALFARSSNVLDEGGLMTADSASESRSTLRAQFMAGLQKLSYQKELEESRRGSAERERPGVMSEAGTALVHRRTSQQPAAFQGTPNAQLEQLTWEMNNMDIIRRPSNELQLATVASPFHAHSYYHSTFEERGLLGRGGFGRVYHTYNVLDQRDYAVKKIPLSPKLSQRYREGGYKELTHILREVQALARLDHCNVVRYHAAWIEAPSQHVNALFQSQPVPLLSQRGQMLLDNKPAQQHSPPYFGTAFSGSDNNFTDPFGDAKSSRDGPLPIGRVISATSEEEGVDASEANSFDPFARSDNDPDRSKPLWSAHVSHNVSISAPSDAANLFTDGRSRHASSLISHIDDPSVYVLHVQMSMYPLTLAEYLLPPSSPHKHSLPASQRHCFHLIPALRLLLSILCGLQYIHSQGFVHRDVKPSNIFLSTLGFMSPLAFSAEQGYADIGSCPSCSHASPRFVNPRIGDFGLVAELAKATDSAYGSPKSDDSSRAVGTEYYRPPQHKDTNGATDERVDVFALGVILLELLCSCATRMERIALLQGAQKGQIPDGMHTKLRTEGHDEAIAACTERCITGMIHPDPKQRWRCGMVKERVEEILSMISDQRSYRLPD